jgi:hypothetical protein
VSLRATSPSGVTVTTSRQSNVTGRSVPSGPLSTVRESPVEDTVIGTVDYPVHLQSELRPLSELLGKGASDSLATGDRAGAGVKPELCVLGVQPGDRDRVARFPGREVALRQRRNIDNGLRSVILVIGAGDGDRTRDTLL